MSDIKLIDEERVKDKYMAFCQFGDKANTGTMEGKAFLKFIKDCGIMNPKSLTQTDVDLIFARAKPKSGRKLEYRHFLQALVYVSEKRYPQVFKEEGASAALAKIYEAIINSEGPSSSGTKADFVKFHDDKSTYTGVYSRGGPTNIDNKITLSSLADRSPADARGIKR